MTANCHCRIRPYFVVSPPVVVKEMLSQELLSQMELFFSNHHMYYNNTGCSLQRVESKSAAQL
jgi:hypothetical protein